MRIAGGGGINWRWFLWFTIQDDGKIYIHRHDRKHMDSWTTHPETDSGYSIREDNERTAIAVLLSTGKVINNKLVETEYVVANPKYVFDYNEKV